MRNLILLIALVILSISCRSFPDPDRELVVEQCSPFFVWVDEHTINADESKCQCRTYKYSAGYMGPITEAQDYHITNCAGMVGNPELDYAQVATFLETLRRDLAAARESFRD